MGTQLWDKAFKTDAGIMKVQWRNLWKCHLNKV